MPTDDRMLGDYEIKARDPTTTPTKHYEKDRNTNELRSLESQRLGERQHKSDY